MKLSELYKEKNNFDFVRFVLASLVLYSHFFYLYTGKQHSENKGEIIYTLTNGQLDGGSLAVNMFFVISGFLITISWFNNPNVLSYIIKRLLRIIPGLNGVIIFVVFIISPSISNDFKLYFENLSFFNIIQDLINMTISINTVQNIFSNLPISTVNGSLWTLKYELYCYIMILILGVSKLLNRYTVLIFFSIFFSIYVMQMYEIVELDRGIPIPRLFTFFLIGSIIYFFRDYIVLSKRYAIYSLVLLFISVITGVVQLYIIFGLSYLLFIFIYSRNIKFTNFAKYGDLSYGMYIYAFPLQQLTLFLFKDINFYLYMIVSFVLTIFMAWFSWHFIEKKSLKISHNKKLKNYLKKLVTNVNK